MSDYPRPSRLMPDLARSPLLKTNDNAPMLIGQIYRRVFDSAKSLALITDIDNSFDERHETTKNKYRFSVGPDARISYLVISILEPDKRAKDQSLTIGSDSVSQHRTTFKKFKDAYPYLCFCPHSFPFFVTHTSTRSRLEEISDAFNPTSERVKQIERSRWRHSQTK